VVIALIAPGLSMAQLQVRDRTPGGELTGYYWTDLSKQGRIDFLFGFQAGYSAAQPNGQGDAQEYWERNNPFPGGTYGELVQAIDTFFANAENRAMPITAVMQVIKMKRDGKPQTEIDERLARYRDVFVKGPKESCESGTRFTAEECKARGYAFKSKTAKPEASAKP